MEENMKETYPRRQNMFAVKIGGVNEEILKYVEDIHINSKQIVIKLIAYDDVDVLSELAVNNVYNVGIYDILDNFYYIKRLCFLKDIEFDLSKSSTDSVVFVITFDLVAE